MTHPRLLGATGLLFVAIGVVSVPSAFWAGAPDEGDVSAQELLRYYNDSGNQSKLMIAGVLALLAGVLFLVYVAMLRDVLGESGWLGTLATGSGFGFAVLWIASDAVATAVPAASAYSDAFGPKDADAALALLVLGNHWLISFAATAAAPLVAAASAIAQREALLPRWIAWVGYVVAVLLLLAAPSFGITIIGLFLWLLLTSLYWLVRPPPQSESRLSSRR